MSEAANPASSANIVAEVIDNGEVSAQQLLVVGLCLFFNMLDGFDITAMAVVAGAVSTELQLTPDRLGWIFSFALAGMMAGAMFLAPVSDIIGRRKLIIISVCLVGASIILTANANSLLEFIFLRFISGMGAGAMLACQATLSAEYSPDKYRAASVAVVTSGYPMGAMMTSVVAGYIMPEFGWRGMFWFGGLFTLAMGLVAWMLIPESRHQGHVQVADAGTSSQDADALDSVFLVLQHSVLPDELDSETDGRHRLLGLRRA